MGLMPDPMSDILDRIHDKITKASLLGVWLRADFLDIGTPNAVEKAVAKTDHPTRRHPPSLAVCMTSRASAN